MLYYPDDMINLIIKFSGDLSCSLVCRKWNRIIKNNKLKLYKFNYTEWLPIELLSLIFESSGELDCSYVCKSWANIIVDEFKIYCANCNIICKKNIVKECSLCKLKVYANAFNFLLVMDNQAVLRYSM